jgi:prepilin-type N-terminal cleavage/methylation domain-containing protein
MKTMRAPVLHRSLARRAFSLVEMLVAVGLLSLIILALYAMFDQTQRALRGSVGQVDVFEGSRSAIQLLSLDLEHARPAGVVDGPHFLTRLAVPAELIQNQDDLFQERQPVLQEFFAVRNVTDMQWSVFGYFVASETDPTVRTTPPIGTLYRYEDRNNFEQRIPGETTLTNTPVRFSLRRNAAQVLVEHVLNRPQAGPNMLTRPYRTNAARVLDGVVNFKVTPFDALGRPYNAFYPNSQLPPRPQGALLDPIILNHLAGGLVTETTFQGLAMPAYVEIEVDAMEPRLLEQFRALPDNLIIRNRYLTNNLARIQSFRQRIQIRSTFR